MSLITLALRYRTLHFYAQGAHHKTIGSTFMQDHEHLETLYTAYASAFDVLVETDLANSETVDEHALNLSAVKAAAAAWTPDQDRMLRSKSPTPIFETLLHLETQLQTLLSQTAKDADLADQNLLSQLAQESKHRALYKIAQRLA